MTECLKVQPLIASHVQSASRVPLHVSAGASVPSTQETLPLRHGAERRRAGEREEDESTDHWRPRAAGDGVGYSAEVSAAASPSPCCN